MEQTPQADYFQQFAQLIDFCISLARVVSEGPAYHGLPTTNNFLPWFRGFSQSQVLLVFRQRCS